MQRGPTEGGGEIHGLGSKQWRGRRGRDRVLVEGKEKPWQSAALLPPPPPPETGCFSLALGLGRPWASLPTPDEGTVYFEVHSPGVYRDLFGTLHAFDPLDQQMPLALSLPAKVTRRWNSCLAWHRGRSLAGCSEIGTRWADSGWGGRKQGKGPGLLVLTSLPCGVPWPPPLSGSWGCVCGSTTASTLVSE